MPKCSSSLLAMEKPSKACREMKMEEEKPSLGKRLMGIFKGPEMKEEKLSKIEEEEIEVKSINFGEQKVDLDSDE
jgi:hypothetical protein